MDRELFAQYLSEWLDQPEKPGLGALVESAAAADPALAKLKEQWLGVDRLVRAADRLDRGIDWPRLRERIGGAVEQTSIELGCEERLRAVTDIDQRVDWARLRERLSQTVAGVSAPPLGFRAWLRGGRVGLTLVGAAAAILVVLAVPRRTVRAPEGAAQVRVCRPADLVDRGRPQRSFVRVAVSAPPGAEPTSHRARAVAHSTETAPPGSGPEDARLAEVFLMVEPARAGRSPGTSPFPLSFH